MASSWLFMPRRLSLGKSTKRFCIATSNFDKCHYIRCLRAEFAAKHPNVPLSLTTRWKMEPDFGSWQTPDISRSHLYRGTIAWTPPTAIYRAYTVPWKDSLYIETAPKIQVMVPIMKLWRLLLSNLADRKLNYFNSLVPSDRIIYQALFIYNFHFAFWLQPVLTAFEFKDIGIMNNSTKDQTCYLIWISVEMLFVYRIG